MKPVSRRLAMTSLAFGVLALAAHGAQADSAAQIEQDVDYSLQKLYTSVPGSRDLAARARGVLVMPDVIKGGLIIGGSYGEGALKIAGVTDNYYSVAAASIGYQIGVQSTSHALFFMTDEALQKFRTSEGWELGADAEFTVPGDGISLNLDSTTIKSPVIAIIYAQDGLLAGASLEGAKYTRIAR